MSTPRTPQRGDQVFFDYGCMCGDSFGTVVGIETHRFGTNYWVRLKDFTVTVISRYTGEVVGEICEDFSGEEFFSAHETTLYTPNNGSPIGAFLATNPGFPRP